MMLSENFSDPMVIVGLAAVEAVVELELPPDFPQAPAMMLAKIISEASGVHHSVLDVLFDHLQVLWGALVAFVVVVLLTPAVGGLAETTGAGPEAK